MNAILLTFIILAAAFMASSANNMATVMTALDDFLDMANIPDYWFYTPFSEEVTRLHDFAEENGYELLDSKTLQIDPKAILIEGEKFEYANSVLLSANHDINLFDENGAKITHVNDGEIYVTSHIFSSVENNFFKGCKIQVNAGGTKKEFTLKGCTKDALFGSAMVGMTRFVISDNDFKSLENKNANQFRSLAIYTKDSSFREKIDKIHFQSVFNVERSEIKQMYLLDMLKAAVVLIVSLCLILISMVILRFTIHFTMKEEFREIGVMKAIGIHTRKIRSIYILKYFAISIIGAVTGLALSFPFGALLLENASQNIVLLGEGKYYLNVIFALGTAAVVVLYCYLCTGSIKKASPIDAIRNGETGERYTRKGILHLNRSKLSPILFMSLNDILSGMKHYVSMIIIFTLGFLLIILPVNTINTLQSDKLIILFNMAECDTVIAQELLFSPKAGNNTMIRQKQDEVKEWLRNHNLEADVFQEIMFRLNISRNGKSCSSLAFIGTGGVTTDQYSYIDGTAPKHKGEVALSYIVADKIGAKIGDTVEIENGNERKKFIVTALNQSMNNMGESIRFYEGEDIDYRYAAGSFGIQMVYRDRPDIKTIRTRIESLKKAYPNAGIYTAGEYINEMIGDSAGQLEGTKNLILIVVICINVLVAFLMARSFITREKGEIAMLKATGFHTPALILWQSLRIGIILLISILIGTVLSIPLLKIIIEPIFSLMGAYSIKFDIRPLEVYVTYPVMVLSATILATAASALHIRKISASETSNIE